MDKIRLGKQIRIARETYGYSMEKLAELADVSTTTIKNIEAGRINSCKIELLEKIADVLNVQMYILIPEFIDTNVNKLSKTLSEHLGVNCEEDPQEYEEYVKFQKLFYPDVSDMNDYPIKTLTQFFLYLPLMNWYKLSDILLNRLGGDVFRRDYYILQQLEYLYHDINDSPARKYADYKKRELNYEGFLRFIEQGYSDDEYKNSEEYRTGKSMYYDRLCSLPVILKKLFTDDNS